MTLTEEEIASLKQQIDAVNLRIWNLRSSPNLDDNPEAIVGEALENSIKINYSFGIAQCYLNQAMGAFVLKHNYPLSEELSQKALEIFTEIQNEKWIANVLITQAIIKNSTGNPQDALYLGLKGFDFYNNTIDDQDYPMACYIVGTIYKDLKKIAEAEKYYNLGITNIEDYNSWSARLYAGLSNIQTSRGNYSDALSTADKALEILRKENNNIGISRLLNDIGVIQTKLKEFDKALAYFFESLEIRRNSNLKHFVLGSLIEIAAIYVQKNESEKAIPYYNEALELATEIKHTGRQATCYKQLSKIYKSKGDFKQASNYLEQLLSLNETHREIEKETIISQSENKLIKEKEDEIERLKNVELKNAYDLIAEKNKEITDSIHYANRIQKTILAPKEEMEKYLCEHFVFFQPKDIVSGDFYWSLVMDRENGDQDFYLAVCDSTGHGVPGAFMSLLNTNFLNEAIREKELIQPNEIFNYVRNRLVESISKEGQKDGFDGVLIRMDLKNDQLFYSAANCAPVLIRNGELSLLPMDRMPVGYGEKKEDFKLHQFQLQKGDVFYLFTDGYADQFGGPQGKKFKYKPFYQLLSEIANIPMDQQKQKLHQEIENWKGNLEQVDDVCVIGVRV